MTRTLSPSELAQHFEAAPDASVTVGGRVVSLGGAEARVADAWMTVTVTSAAWPTDLGLGELVELSVSRPSGAAGYQLERVVSRAPGGLGPELARLSWGGRAHALRARGQALQAIRRDFQDQGFLEVDTPSFVPCPGLDAHVQSLAAVERGARRDYLITSPELHMKRLVVGGLPRIFQVARAYRAEELGALHEPEFTLLEWYRAFEDVEAVMADTERIVRAVAEAVGGKLEFELKGRTIALSSPFERRTVSEAFAEFAEVDDVTALVEENEARYYELLVSAVEPGLSRIDRPVFLTHYPTAHAALARRDPADPRFAQRFELYLAGVELCNGFGELVDPDEQRRRFVLEQARRTQAGEPVYPLDERFLAALGEGLPRSSGNALGLDRLVALAVGAPDIATTLAFPDQDR